MWLAVAAEGSRSEPSGSRCARAWRFGPNGPQKAPQDATASDDREAQDVLALVGGGGDRRTAGMRDESPAGRATGAAAQQRGTRGSEASRADGRAAAAAEEESAKESRPAAAEARRAACARAAAGRRRARAQGAGAGTGQPGRIGRAPADRPARRAERTGRTDTGEDMALSQGKLHARYHALSRRAHPHVSFTCLRGDQQ